MKNKLTGFAEACFNMNSPEEMVILLAGEPDEIDCSTWKITGDEWRAGISAALENRLWIDSSTDNG